MKNIYFVLLLLTLSGLRLGAMPSLPAKGQEDRKSTRLNSSH